MRRACVVAIAVLGVAGCGGGDDAASAGGAGAEPVGKQSAGSVATFADCADWRRADKGQRYATIRVLRGRLTPELSKTAASPLSDERAYEAFQNTCSQGIDSLRLYKLYVKIQGFEPLNPR
jgi:hypothetical protein